MATATVTATDVAALEVAQVSSIDEKHASEESVSAEGNPKSRIPTEHELGIYGEDVEFPTDEEIATLRRVADKMPIGAFAIVIVELCERFAFYGALRYKKTPFQFLIYNF
jgi:proton-dependent oligopeptide transporter, POT family